MTSSGNQDAGLEPVRGKMWAEQDQDFAGIHRLELPLPFRPGSINVYLVPQERGWILVDCGVEVPGALSAYEQAGVQWSSIRRIFLTHAHPDHSGLSTFIREEAGAPVCMHPNEHGVLQSMREPEPWMDWQDSILLDAGVPRDFRFCIRRATRELRSFYPAITADSFIEDGAVIPTAAGPMQAMLTPGHSPGHLCFYFPETKILLAGDQLLRQPSPHVEWYSDGFAVDEYRASLDAFARLDVDWVLPAHGRAFSGLKQRIRYLLEHSYHMEEKIQTLAANGKCSTHDLASVAWRVPLPPFEHRNAIFEALAYLQHQKKRDQSSSKISLM